MKFDLRNRLEFNVEGIYAHLAAEDLLEESRGQEDSYPDLISCDENFKEFLLSNQVISGTFECHVMNAPALAIVWKCGNGHKGLVCLKSDEEGISNAMWRQEKMSLVI